MIFETFSTSLVSNSEMWSWIAEGKPFRQGIRCIVKPCKLSGSVRARFDCPGGLSKPKFSMFFSSLDLIMSEHFTKWLPKCSFSRKKVTLFDKNKNRRLKVSGTFPITSYRYLLTYLCCGRSHNSSWARRTVQLMIFDSPQLGFRLWGEDLDMQSVTFSSKKRKMRKKKTFFKILFLLCLGIM